MLRHWIIAQNYDFLSIFDDCCWRICRYHRFGRCIRRCGRFILQQIDKQRAWYCNIARCRCLLIQCNFICDYMCVYHIHIIGISGRRCTRIWRRRWCLMIRCWPNMWQWWLLLLLLYLLLAHRILTPLNDTRLCHTFEWIFTRFDYIWWHRRWQFAIHGAYCVGRFKNGLHIHWPIHSYWWINRIHSKDLLLLLLLFYGRR